MRVHPWFWLAAAVLILDVLRRVTTVGQLLLILVPWTAAFFVGVLTHELGHAFTMRALGRPPRITLYGFGGLTSSDYKPLYRAAGFSTWGQVLISFAGPAAGFLLAALIVLLCIVSGHGIVITLGGLYGIFIGVSPFASLWLWSFVQYLLIICVFWGLVNLLPIYPLDGGQIARELLVHRDPRRGIRQSLILSIVTAGAMVAVAALRWGDLFLAIFFGYFAYSNYQILQAYEGGR